MNSHYLYLAVNLGCVLFPFLLSFERRVHFIGNIRALMIGTIAMMALFIPWDIAFTHAGIWGFNDTYIIGEKLFGLPLEEWLFFICIPYACIFSYECVRYFKPVPPGRAFTVIAGGTIVAVALVLAIVYHDHHYTMVACTLCAILLALHLWLWKSKWLGWLLIAWFILLVPFYISNGILTGITFWEYPVFNTQPEVIADQIVWYNNAHNLGLRIWTVPADDFFYGLLMVLLAMTVYERVLNRSHGDAATPQGA
jgi:lycopene cyclase domain-containing protein